MTLTRPYRGRTADERRLDRRRLLLDAGLECLAADGIAQVSVRSVCSLARLTPRYFYESFANLDELLLALVDHVGDEVADSGVRTIASTPGTPAERVRAAVSAGFGVVLGDRRKAQVLLAAAGHEPMQRRRQEYILRYADIVVEHLVGDVDPLHARRMALFLVGGAVELLTATLSGMLQMDDDELIEETTGLLLAVLGSGGLAPVDESS